MLLRSTSIVLAALALASSPAWAGKGCEDLKSEIAGKIDAKGVKGYTLDIVPTADVKDGDGKVVGSCEGGNKKIVYKRG
jgi:hypothetical protein